MKRIPLILLALVILPIMLTADAGARIHMDDWDHDCGPFRGDDISIDIEGDGTLAIICDEYDDIVEITEDYELYINGDRIKLDSKQQKLVKKYYDGFNEIIDLAQEIGIEGARVGVEGAKLGLKAVAKLVKLLEEDYDSEDLEREMEKEAEKIEKKAEKLEKKAERIEDEAEKFERTHYKLRDSIKELEELEWF